MIHLWTVYRQVLNGFFDVYKEYEDDFRMSTFIAFRRKPSMS